MEPKRSKYDTNPLDEDVANRADESFGNKPADASTEGIGGVTQPVSRAVSETSRGGANHNEAPTRRIDDKVTSYPSVFVPPPPRRPAQTYEPPRINSADVYQPPPVPPLNVYQPPSLPTGIPGFQTVQGLGIQERWAVMVPYLPFWLGIVGAVIELLVVPRSESRVRFHASQALVLQLAITAVTILLGGLGSLTGHWSGAGLFRFATFVFLVIAMVRVFKGNSFVIPLLDEPRRWLDEKLKPRK
jgi:uncharacterized membrane protein